MRALLTPPARTRLPQRSSAAAGRAPATAVLGLVVLALCLLPRPASSQCVCGNGDGQFTRYVGIAIDGEFDDWPIVLFDPDNNSCDGGTAPDGTVYEPQPDLDAPVQSTGRDLLQFAYTWDATYVYAYTLRVASATNVINFIYYADIDNDGFMTAGEPIIVAKWRGSNRRVDLSVGSYVPSNPAGDPMVDTDEKADGYTLPGNVSGLTAIGSGTWGSVDGVRMEWRISWATLGLPPNSPFTFHIASTNATPGSGGFASQIDDNMGGCGGGAATTQYAGVIFDPDRSLYAEKNGSTEAIHTVTNTGNGIDSYNLSYAVTYGFTPRSIQFYHDVDGSNGLSAGDTLLTDTDGDGRVNTASLVPDGTFSVLIVYEVGAVSDTVSHVTTTAISRFDSTITDAVVDDISVTSYPNLSKSTKSVTDLNGGDAMPGDVLRYTITLTETANNAASGVVVTDDIPAGVTGFQVVSIPAGAVDQSTFAGTGANGTGFLHVTDISVPKRGTRQIVFEVTIGTSAQPGDIIANMAYVEVPNGANVSVVAPNVVVDQSHVPASGPKPLYLNDLSGTPKLSRTPPVYVTSLRLARGASRTLTLTPALADTGRFGAGTRLVSLWLARNATTNTLRTVQVSVSYSGPSSGSIGSDTQTLDIAVAGLPGAQYVNFDLQLTQDLVLLPGTAISLTIVNNSASKGLDVQVYSHNQGSYSLVNLNASRAVNVDWVRFYDAPYTGAYPGGGAEITYERPHATVYCRALVSDPFGAYDITGATLTLRDALNSVRVNEASMVRVYSSGADSALYEYSYSFGAGGPDGWWIARVTAEEGFEGEVTHVRNASIDLRVPDIVVVKYSQTIRDPVNDTTNPFAIPGAEVLYRIALTNQGRGWADGGSVIVSEDVPAHLDLFVGDLGSGGSGPVAFLDGSPASGLSYSFGGLGNTGDSISFSNDGGLSWGYVPTPDADGYDAAVTNVRIVPGGTFAGSSGSAPHPSCEFRLKMRVE